MGNTLTSESQIEQLHQEATTEAEGGGDGGDCGDCYGAGDEGEVFLLSSFIHALSVLNGLSVCL